MSIVSAAFLAFVALVALCYFAVPKRVRWTVLLVASYVFFFINSEKLIVVLFAQTVFTFLIGRWMAAVDRKHAANAPSADDKHAVKAAKAAAKKAKSRIEVLGVVGNLATLLVLKYWNFFADSGNVLLAHFGVQLPSIGLLIPIGLSFYTLQAIAYIIDVKRGKVQADGNLFKFMLFMSFFPQIVQGPIPRYKQLASQLYEGHAFDYNRMCYGAQLMLWGFVKKLVIANRLAIPVDQVFDNFSYYSGPIVLLAAVGYGLQVYADFSGGIDVARGVAQILGIDMAENFKQPYFSRSIEEFWRRWHITLGAWMRDYVFFPLSLSKAASRVGRVARRLFGTSVGKKAPPIIATFIVFILVGGWHGASWSFVAYGLWNGFFIALGILLADRYAAAKGLLKVRDEGFSWRLFQMVRTILICSLGRLFVRSDGVHQALHMFRSMFDGWYDLSFLVNGDMVLLGLNTANWFVLVAAIVVLLATDIAHERGVKIREAIARQGIVFRWLVYLCAFCAALVLGEYGSGASIFVYQQF